MTNVFSVINQKGGVGKSTLSINIACTLLERGFRVLICDADDQETSTACASISEHNKFVFPDTVVIPKKNDLHKVIAEYGSNYDFTIIDCPPSVKSDIPKIALTMSDLAIVPFRPNAPDLWSGAKILNLIYEYSKENKDLKACIVFNQVEGRVIQANKIAMQMLRDNHYDFPVLKTQIQMKNSFPISTAMGGSVHLYKRGRASIDQINRATDEILKLMQLPLRAKKASAKKKALKRA